MIDFKPVRPEDRAAIERFTLRSETENCDFAFANMYCWRFLYDSRWAVVEGFLVVRFRIGGGGRLGYMQPLGPGDFVSVLPQLEADARAHGQRLRLAGLDEAACAHLRSAAGEEYALASDPATDDYVYDAEALRTLPGRRYQSKRNHINRFLSLWPDYRYEALTPDRFAECLRLERRWRAEHADRPASELGAEQRAMQEAFDCFETLGLTGGCLYAGDTLVAFTFGSAVNEHTFDTHVEKADTNYDGAFALINRTFAEHLPARYTRINREEDLGIEGLRRAKSSYHPALRLRKYAALKLAPDERAVRRLWREAFGDDDAFIDAFLIHAYDRRRMLVHVEASGLAAMLHAVPFECEAGRVTYVYGVATARDRRGRGLATELLRRAEAQARERGDAALLLIPADDALRAFYERLGYRGDLPVRFKETPGAFDFGTGDPLRDRAMILPLKPWPQLPEALECRYAGAPADACPDAKNAFAHSDTAVADELADECPERALTDKRHEKPVAAVHR